MNENLAILHRKLDNLERMRGDVHHSLGKLDGPLETLRRAGVAALSPDQRETLSAFTTRFAVYQEHMGKAMRSLAIEEESATTPFGAILALMEKLGILDDSARWGDARSLRNAVNHEYEDNAEALRQILENMAAAAEWLTAVHDRLLAFVRANHPLPSGGPT
ncbi:MAG: hypothetical protein FGM40_04920 [Rhodocyclaceae bacterium]|nr:hypothetical protein [Rhodocyclaceae bacterium]